MSSTGFFIPLRNIEIRLLDALNLAAYEANRMNRALRRCVIGKISLKRDPASTFHHPA